MGFSVETVDEEEDCRRENIKDKCLCWAKEIIIKTNAKKEERRTTKTSSRQRGLRSSNNIAK